MVKGYIITKWTEDRGLILQLSYPETLSVDMDDMMRIFYAHITGAAEAGNVVVRLEKVSSNVSSYFNGMDAQVPFMINLMLELDEDPEIFGEKVISEINSNILSLLNALINEPSSTYEITEELKDYIKNSLFLLERLKNLSKEQRMAQIFVSEKGRAILESLREKAYSRKELRESLEEKLGKSIYNLEISLDPFVKTDLIKQDWIEGDSDISLFLISDFTIMRVPATKLIEDAKNNLPTPYLANQYLEQVNSYFSNYTPNNEDNLKIAYAMINPDKYDFITLFREKAYPINKIPKSPGETFDEIKEMLNTLEQDKILTIIKDQKGLEWIFLLTDPIAQTFYPEYMIENIREKTAEKKLKKKTAIKYLELLEQFYKK
ncbi:MAG: hypothetical protein EU531_09440 [Promethearchaeota archaeon]|nr:MAG: hypothetical protein EU531_09440 [Candidatus Lokiarchaeota archaeon]